MPRARGRRLIVALASLTACHGNHSASHANHAADAHVVEAPAARGARIIVDVSESNRGFVLPGSVALESLQRSIDTSLSTVGWNQPLRRCRLDESVHCAAEPMPPQAFRNASLYRGRNAALHRVLRHGSDPSGEDPLDTWAVTVLVTDGFESTSAPFLPDAGDDVACAAGADPGCIAALLRRRVTEGYGVWVVRLWMPFNGRYFAERRLDSGSWQRVQDHIGALGEDPSWEGVRFAVSGPDLASESGPFTFVGARPLLLFVLSRDVAGGRRFVDEMVRRVRLEHITVHGRDEDVDASEWAPFEGFTAQAQRAVRADNGGAADEVVLDRVRRTPDALTVPVQCNLRGRARVRVDGVLNEGAVPPPPFARIGFAWRRGAHTGNELVLPAEPIAARAGPFSAFPTLDCTVMPAGASRYELMLWGHWDLDEHAFADSWFVRESSDTSYEMPERVYGLSSLARAVIDLSLQRDGAMDRVVFAVERE